ncbi:diguanylate cyclase [Acidovorax sp. SUPP2825]|uniref:sensor domain-containing diguanylate cyclase n=1 Tax=Acidovorax sp. SUPP2825 TaxID=2920879 RepID=UPI0023DE4F26|nr:diguanylate cyclase [Acidovorax sp. SUPP2825]GKS94437.1 diguanylate cyclase [Acidovorax sp. SUPP2825]
MKTTDKANGSRQSFRGQLTLLFGGLSLASLLGVGVYVGHIATGELARFGGELLHTSARSAADLLATNLRERAQEIDLLRQLALFTRGDLSAQEMRQALDLRKTTHNEYAWIGVTDASGRVTQATDGVLVGAQVEHRPWFQSARSGLFVGDVHEAVLLAKQLPNRNPDQPLRFIDFAAPILDEQGQLRGVLGAHAHWSWVTETVESIVVNRVGQHGAEVLIADKAGHILYPFQHAGLLNLPAGASPQAQSERLQWSDGAEYLTSMVEIPTVAHTDLGWRIVLRQPLDKALAPVKALRQQLILLGLLTALACALVAYRLAARISRPIEQLARAARMIENRAGTPVYPGDEHASEITQLNHSFQSMTASLLERERELSQLNTSLEAQVAERTQALHRANQELENLAIHDALTGLYNRRRFDEKLREYVQLFQRTGRTFALLVIDADHFKHVNDHHGHQAGDAVLQQLAQVISGSVRITDFVARYGGEEFVVLLPEPQDRQEGRVVAEKIRVAVSQSHFPAVGQLTVSLGMSFCSLKDTSETDIVQRADQALYQAKQQGRNQLVVATESA